MSPRRVRRPLAGGALAALLALASPSIVFGALLWTLVATPLTATTGESTTFTLTATNEDPLADVLSDNEIGCVAVDVPSNFRVDAIGMVGSSTGDKWIVKKFGQQVRAQTTSGGDRLKLLDWVKFTIRATPLSAGSLAWNATAYRDQDCKGSGSLVGVPPVIVVSGAAVTPTPTPTPTPSPTPTPTRTPTPSPTPTPTSSPTPTPILPLPSVGLPTPTPAPAPSTTQSGSPEATPAPPPDESAPAPEATASPNGGAPGSSPGAAGSDTVTVPGGGQPAGLTIAAIDEEAAGGIGLDLAAVDMLDGFGDWSIPAAVVGGPGVLVLLWVALQTAGTLAWIPAVRRLRGEDRRRSLPTRS